MRGRPASRVAGLIVAVAALFPRAQAVRADDVLVVSPDVMAGFEEYKKRKKPMYFAVSADGLVYWYIYCPERQCDTIRDYRRRAIDECEKAGGTDCRIFAIGEDIEVDFRIGDPAAMVPARITPCVAEAVAADTAAGAIVQGLRPGECDDFNRYRFYDHFKAFATTDFAKYRSTWGWSYRYDTPAEAIRNALEQCDQGRKDLGIPDDCEIFAIGGIVVYGMSEAELRAAAEVYKTNRDAANAELPPGD
jgi:hypothetical protein